MIHAPVGHAYDNTNQEIPRHGHVFEGYYQHLPGRREIFIVSGGKAERFDDVGHQVMRFG